MSDILVAESVDLTTADRFSIATPGDWVVLPLDPRTRDRRIARLVGRRLGKDDRSVHIRRQVVVRLRKAAADAADAGAFFAAVHGRALSRDVAVSASAMASLHPLLTVSGGDPLGDADAIATAVSSDADGPAAERTIVDLPIGRAVRLRRQTPSGVHGSDGREVICDDVQYYVPMPGVEKTLALTFSTPMLRFADLYGALFEAMARTARWVEAPEKERVP